MKSKNIFNIIKLLAITLTLIFNFTMNCEGDDKIDVKFLIFLLTWGYITHIVTKYYINEVLWGTGPKLSEEEQRKADEIAKYAADFFKEEN